MESSGQLGKYSVEKELAQSTICSVYRAREESLRRPVLIKKLHPQMAREEDIRSRFEREAQVCAQLSHENIVAIYGFHVDPELTMLVLEFVEGTNLGSLIDKQGTIPWKIVLNLLYYIFSGLNHAHSKGVIHRDIKPENILISNDGRVKITDFGLATLEDAPKLTIQGMVLGTPAYMPPEGLSGGKVDAKSDLFSTGVTAYEMLTGVSPFLGENFSDTMSKILKNSPPKPSAVVAGIPQELDALVMRLMEKQPSKRYATSAQVLIEIGSIAKQYDVNLAPVEVEKFIQGKVAPVDGKTGAANRAKTVSQKQIVQTPSKMYWIYGAVSLIVITLVLWMSGIFETKHITEVNTPIVLLPALVDTERTFDNVVISDTSKIEVSEQKPEPVIEFEPEEKPEVTNIPLVARRDEEGNINPSNERSSASFANGSIYLTIKPWANVFIDNVFLGLSPLREPINLPPGKYQMVLVNDEFPAPYVTQIEVEPGKVSRMEVDLFSQYGSIKFVFAKPWADIYINGVGYGSTPRNIPIILSPGKYVLELRNEQFQTWRKEFDIMPGDLPIEINANLEQHPNK